MRSRDLAERREAAVEALAESIYPLMQGTQGKEFGELSEEEQARAREAARAAIERRDGVLPWWLSDEEYPRSPREALLMILAEVPEPEAGDYVLKRTTQVLIREVAQLGLGARGDLTFEDELADRLAEALDILVKIRRTFEMQDPNPLTEGDNPMLDVEIDSALALPPTLEGKIERRMKERTP